VEVESPPPRGDLITFLKGKIKLIRGIRNDTDNDNRKGILFYGNKSAQFQE
jgi:hypothetical protein